MICRLCYSVAFDPVPVNLGAKAHYPGRAQSTIAQSTPVTALRKTLCFPIDFVITAS